MKLKEILSITGMPGLYKTVAQTKNGVIVESLNDGKRTSVTSNIHKATSLGDITIFTSGDDLPLADVFRKMDAGEAERVDSKADATAQKDYFKKLVPDMDESRVHASHMKKILGWYELLKGKVDFNEKETEEDSESSVPVGETGKPAVKAYESNAPKADQHKKTTTVKLRKKV